jgi:hypothetical protein
MNMEISNHITIKPPMTIQPANIDCLSKHISRKQHDRNNGYRGVRHV